MGRLIAAGCSPSGSRPLAALAIDLAHADLQQGRDRILEAAVQEILRLRSWGRARFPLFADNDGPAMTSSVCDGNTA